jgi:hypothetical protein
MEQSNHARLLDAGWSRAAYQGWIRYRDPVTGLWHTLDEAIKILDAREAA